MRLRTLGGLITALFVVSCSAGVQVEEVQEPKERLADVGAEEETSASTVRPAVTTRVIEVPPVATTTEIPTTTTIETPITEIRSAADCYLSSNQDVDITGWEPALSLSHERPGYRLQSTGTIEVIVLFAEFQDVIAKETTQSIYSIISPSAEEFITDQSYGRLQLSFRPHHSWLRLSSNASVYASAIKTYEGHREFMQEAIDLADDKVDFSDADAVLVVATPNAQEIAYGPAWMGMPYDPLRADGQVITNGVTSGADLTYWRGGWYPHELGHSLGLPDLYGASIPGRGGWTRPFSLMDLISGSAPGYMGYSRWILRWLDDSQIRCISSDATLELTALANAGGPKLAIVPLTASTALVAEVRRAIGYDSALTREGLVVYVVNTNNLGRTGGSYGAGPIEVLNEANALQPGEAVVHSGISFKVLQSLSDKDLVQITVEDNS